MITQLQNSLDEPRKSLKRYSHIPDFLIIGAGKSGTTSLDKYLQQHPEIFIPAFKEPNFYGYENSKAEQFNNPDDQNHFRQSVTNLQDYLKLFTNATPDQVIGETSNTYLYHEGVPERIKYYNPDMKLIAVLRQPAGRLYSRFMHLARENRTPTATFEECFDKNTIWWKRNDLVKEGFYYKNLSKFYETFPRENIRVFLYEDFNSNPEKVLKEIYQFLGVKADFQTNHTTRFNQSGFIRNKFLDKIYGQKGVVTGTLKTMLPKSVIKTLKSSMFVQKQLNDLRSKNLAKPKMDLEVRKKLTSEVYGDDIRQLEKLIERDLSHWFVSK
ncbi:MAG TPA: sulfotransferase [Chryseosolibacter sp.]|nr:sulfotransferase [Chryseosolibacter sp.]